MADRPTGIRRVIAAIFSESAWQAFWTYAFPPLSTLATAALGYSEKQPLMWVVTAAIFVFAMSSFGLLAFTQWRFKRTPEHKLAFGNGACMRPNNHVILGCVMRNLAEFPMEIAIRSLTVSVASRIPDDASDLIGRPLLVDAGNNFYFTTPTIDIAGVAQDPMIGEFVAEIEYGHRGNRKFIYQIAQRFIIPVDETKPFVNSAKLPANNLTTT